MQLRREKARRAISLTSAPSSAEYLITKAGCLAELYLKAAQDARGGGSESFGYFEDPEQR